VTPGATPPAGMDRRRERSSDPFASRSGGVACSGLIHCAPNGPSVLRCLTISLVVAVIEHSPDTASRMSAAGNPLFDDRDVDFLLYDVLGAERLFALPYFSDHDRDTFAHVVDSARRLARDALFPAYRAMDVEAPQLLAGKVSVHPRLREIYSQLVTLGLAAAPRPAGVGGQQLPLTIFAFATMYLMAANGAAYAYIGLTQGAAHLLEAFGDHRLHRDYMAPMYDGRWTGTMALTEPQAGSSLSDVQTVATPTADGHFLISGNKIFISGGDHDLTDNIVHMTLARIKGAPAGIKGVSLFCVPKRRISDGVLVDNDVAVAGMIHKIGWRGLPSLALSFGERGDCHGYLVGEPHKGISYMFQMMNEARILVGLNGVATASVAYQESLAYARARPQGRAVTARDPKSPQIAIIEHPDVRRMLLRQKAIVEGGMALLLRASGYADLAQHSTDPQERERSQLLLDLLTPIAKSFPAERGFEANTLAVQIHGGYGYSSEYLVESWLRDQKLNSIHEGTTGIQAIDLLGRRAMAGGGAALVAFAAEVERTCSRAKVAGLSAEWVSAVADAAALVHALTIELAQRGQTGDVQAMVAHASDYLDLFSTVAVAWQWLEMAAAAEQRRSQNHADVGFIDAKVAAARYWIASELPRIAHLAHLCRSNESSYLTLDAAAL
jgi:alkylation response protein AidB-like acyl-CoA dehydrogenase